MADEIVNAAAGEKVAADQGTVDQVKAAADAAAVKAAAGESKEKPGDKVEDAKGDKTKSGAPEKYADFTLPDGVKPSKALEAFLPLAKEAGLTQEIAQKFVTSFAEQQKAAATASEKAWDDTVTTWEKETREDPEIGGANFDKNVGLAAAALKKFGGSNIAKLNETLKATGLGNHPELIRLLVNVGKTLSEDELIVGDANKPQSKDRASILYPNQGKQ